MEAHRRMAQRRQAFGTGDPFDSTGGLVSTSTDAVTLTTQTTPVNQPTVVTTTSSTTSTTPSTSSTTSSTPSSVSTPTTVTSQPVPTTPSTTLRQTPSSRTTTLIRSSVTSLTSKPSSTGTSGNGNASSGTNISTGAVVGGIAAGVLGLAGIIFAVLYFIRRLKKRKNDNAFDSDVFRRQSRMLHDEPQVLPDNDNRSPFAPRPPTMIERRMNSTPVSNVGGDTYGSGLGGFNDYNADYNHPGFTPGHVVPHHQSYGDSHMGSPMSAPMSPQMSVNYGDVGAEQPQSAYMSRQPATNGSAPADNSGQYVDLSRSSVTPFQAAQYEEIHRRLNMPPPAPVLGSLAEEEYPREEPAPKGPSPFADPSEDVLPPPSPIHSNSSRVDSNPPMLPELIPPMSPVYALRPSTAEKRTEASTTDLPAAPALAHVVRPNPTTLGQKRPDTVYTIYDDEDAYGGI